MENLAPFRQGHSGNPLDVITTSGRFRMDFFDDCGSHLEAQSIMDRPGWGGGEQKQRWRNYTNRATKNLGFSTTQLQPQKAQRSLLRMIKQESHLTTNLPCFLFAPCTAHNSLCFKMASSSSKKLIEHTEKKTH